jgi:hypothetical protein
MLFQSTTPRWSTTLTADVNGAPRFTSSMANFFTARSVEPLATLPMKKPKRMPHGEPSPPTTTFLKFSCRTLLSATTCVALWARCTLGTEKMTVAAIEVFMSPIARNRTKDALLDLSLNHERLLEENQRVCILLSKSEALIRAYQWRDAAGTSELYTSGARTWSATSSHRRGSVNQQLIEGDDADSQAYALALVSASSSR